MRCICFVAAALLMAGAVHAEDAKNDAKTASLAAGEVKEGFASLFDGKTLQGWVGDVKHYAVEDGAMVCHGDGVYTEKEYANFVLRFEFKLPPGGNNGVGIRTPAEGDAAYAGMEIQILDDGHKKYKGVLRPEQVHGSVYGIAPAKRGFLKPVGQWNQEEIVADGSKIKVTLNGTVITDVDLSKIDKPLDGKEHSGMRNAKGHIGWLGHGADPVAFRNVRLKTLP